MSDEDRVPEEKLRRELMISVREVPDEPLATMLCDFLKSQGIEATVVPVQMPWLGTVATLLHGYWGKIEVLERDAERAARLMDEFLAARPEDLPEDGPEERPEEGP